MAFLTAEWRKLLMANYLVRPEMLQPYVPYGTELDFWQGRCYLSLVGFMFLNTKVLGLPIPFHRDFAEVNLRFYVRRGEKRGVVFIKEIVPKPAISLVANTVYGENYRTCRMRHHWEADAVGYEWKPLFGGTWCKFSAQFSPTPQPLAEGSEAEFITEHFWGYAKLGERGTNEYEVKHPRWELYPIRDYEISGDFGQVYGQDFAKILTKPPDSIFLAEGSEIVVNRKARI